MPLMRFRIDFAGDKQIDVKLGVAAELVQDVSPVWPIIHGTKRDEQILPRRRAFLALTRDQFRSQGKRGGHPWASYDREPHYRARKAGILNAAADQMPILRWVARWQEQPAGRERLYPSLIQPRHLLHVYVPHKLAMEVGTRLGYAGHHQLGTGTQEWDGIAVPRRRILDLTEADKFAWFKAIQRWIHYAIDVRKVRKSL